MKNSYLLYKKVCFENFYKYLNLVKIRRKRKLRRIAIQIHYNKIAYPAELIVVKKNA